MFAENFIPNISLIYIPLKIIVPKNLQLIEATITPYWQITLSPLHSSVEQIFICFSLRHKPFLILDSVV